MGSTEELLGRVRTLANEVLWANALAVDVAPIIPASHLEAIDELGLFAMRVPAELGGLELEPRVIREVLRTLGGGCGATAFVFAQHGGLTAMLSATANDELRKAWLPRLIDGTLAGTAFAHVRRAGPAAVSASHIDGGWRIEGHAPWATSWGLAEVFSLAATTDDGQLLWAVIGGEPSDSIVASDPMSLVVFESTATVSLRFDGLVVPDSDVLSVSDLERWRIGDQLGAVRPNPLCIGVGDRALSELALADPATAERAAPWWADVVASAEWASDVVDLGSGALEPDDLQTIARCRTETILAVQHLTTSLMAAGGGRSADRSHPAQLLARQALFYVVQAQNDDGRAATLASLAP